MPSMCGVGEWGLSVLWACLIAISQTTAQPLAFLGGMSRRRDSFAMKGDEEKASAAGYDHYVTKPHSPIHPAAAHHSRLSRRETRESAWSGF
jgi:hypothetical protein